jgi:hypothetical protein
LGLTFASGFGNDPLRAIPYHIRVPTFAVARQTAIVVFRNARRRIHHALLTSKCSHL